MSRQHAKVVLRGEEAFLEDMGSRNGVRVNNRPVKGSQKLTDGDRLRIGTQELVFCRVVPSSDLLTKRTGFLRHCARCHTPYPEELGTCPHCGASDAVVEEETLSGVSAERQSWTLQLLVEVVQRALSLQRPSDAERLMRRAASNVDERIEAGEQIDRSHLDALGACGARLAEMQGNAHWLQWVLKVYGGLGLLPPALAVEKISSLPPAEQQRLRGPIEQFLGGTLPGSPDDTSLWSRLDGLRRQLEGQP